MELKVISVKSTLLEIVINYNKLIFVQKLKSCIFFGFYLRGHQKYFSRDNLTMISHMVHIFIISIMCCNTYASVICMIYK